MTIHATRGTERPYGTSLRPYGAPLRVAVGMYGGNVPTQASSGDGPIASTDFPEGLLERVTGPRNAKP